MKVRNVSCTRMKKISTQVSFLLIIIASLLYGCGKTFEYSPYSGETIDGYTELATTKNIQEILDSRQESGKFKVAFLTDTHYFHDELNDAINTINKDDEIAFVVFCGDMSDQGMQKEYTMFYEQATKLNKPVLTVIGNHDYLANAKDIYGKMFGPVNYTFDYHGFRFIFFDNIFWEKNGTPDFNWLQEQAASASANSKKPILISHIPFFGDQYDTTSANRHMQIVNDNDISLTIHGHQHSYSYSDAGNSKCLVVPTIGKRSFCTIFFDASAETSHTVNIVNF